MFVVIAYMRMHSNAHQSSHTTQANRYPHPLELLERKPQKPISKILECDRFFILIFHLCIYFQCRQ